VFLQRFSTDSGLDDRHRLQFNSGARGASISSTLNIGSAKTSRVPEANSVFSQRYFPKIVGSCFARSQAANALFSLEKFHFMSAERRSRRIL